MQFLTMKLGVVVVLLYVRIAGAEDEYAVVNSLKFSTRQVEITSAGRNYIDGTVEQSDEPFIRDVKLLQPLDKNATVYFDLDVLSEYWKGGGTALCTSENSFAGSMAKIMRGFLNVEEQDCPVTELLGNTSGEFTRQNIYMPIRLARYEFTVSLSIVDENGNRLVHVVADASGS